MLAPGPGRVARPEHAFAEPHDSAVGARRLAGPRTGRTVQRDPFQTAMNMLVAAMNVLAPLVPSATHLRLVVHDTAYSSTIVFGPAPGGAGTRWIDQRRPFQRSASARTVQRPGPLKHPGPASK